MALQNNKMVVIPIQRNHTRRVEFPKAPGFNLLLVSAQLHQVLGNHDLLVLKFAKKINSKEVSVASYDPVIFTWTSGSEKAVFTGHVHNITPVVTTDNETTITCISSSYVFKNTDQKIYKNVTADQVIQKIANKYGYKAITQRHPKVWKTVVQAGQSDWQIMRRMAHETGFNLKVDNTSVYFLSKDKMVNASKKSAQYFYSENIETASRIVSNLGTVIDFDPIISDDSPDITGVAIDRVVSGIHAVTNETISTTHETNIVDRNNLGIVVPNKEFFQ